MYIYIYIYIKYKKYIYIYLRVEKTVIRKNSVKKEQKDEKKEKTVRIQDIIYFSLICAILTILKCIFKVK